MELTNEKIRVTLSMMDAAGMTRGSKLGVPVDSSDKNKGLIWKDLFEIGEDDLDVIEDYFINKGRAA